MASPSSSTPMVVFYVFVFVIVFRPPYRILSAPAFCFSSSFSSYASFQMTSACTRALTINYVLMTLKFPSLA